MERQERDRERVNPRGRHLSTGFLIFRTAAVTLLVIILALIVVVGAWVAVWAGGVAAEASGKPIEPPGQIGVAALIFVAAVSAGIALAAVGGLALLVWVLRRRARRAAGR